MCAPRARAVSNSSSSSTAPPSPITNPSRSASNGREACSGSSLRDEVALIGSKQAIEIGEIGDSAAPEITMSASPSWISWWPHPTASMPDVQPVEMTVAGPAARDKPRVEEGGRVLRVHEPLAALVARGDVALLEHHRPAHGRAERH